MKIIRELKAQETEKYTSTILYNSNNIPMYAFEVEEDCNFFVKVIYEDATINTFIRDKYELVERKKAIPSQILKFGIEASEIDFILRAAKENIK